VIDKTNVQTNFDPNLPPFTPLISYHHDVNNFQIEFVKKLTKFDVAKGFLVWKMSFNVVDVRIVKQVPIKLLMFKIIKDIQIFMPLDYMFHLMRYFGDICPPFLC